MTRIRPDRHSTLITAGGITAVILAGAFAVAANLGILHASTDTNVGTLSAAGDLLPTTPPTNGAAPATDRAAAGSTAPSGAAAPTSQTYAVDTAGTVTIAIDGDQVSVTSVVANPGWTWTQDANNGTGIRVTFSDHARSLLFDATSTGGDVLNATVGESTLNAPTTATGGATAPRADDHGLYEHEGRNDDD